MPTFSSSTLGGYAGKWLLITGGFELLLAAIFLSFGLRSEELRFGFSLTAGILGVVGVVLVGLGFRSQRRADAAQRVLDTGTPGQATITSLTQTGLFLNQNPQVEMELMITVPGKPAYPATRREFVPLILLNRVGVGMPLAVRVDPSDPLNIVIDWSESATAAAAPGVAPSTRAPAGADPQETLARVQQAVSASGLQAANVFAQAAQGGYNVETLREHLRANGVSGTATIDSVQDTGQMVGDEHVYVIATTVNVPGQPPHRSPPSAAMVPKSAVKKLALGVTVPVKVASDNPDVVMFEWDKL